MHQKAEFKTYLSISLPRIKWPHLKNTLLISLSFFSFMYLLVLVTISARWGAPECNTDWHVEGTSYRGSVSSLN